MRLIYFFLIFHLTSSISTWSYNFYSIENLLTNNKNVYESKQTLIELFKSGDATFENDCLILGKAEVGSIVAANGLTIKLKTNGYCNVASCGDLLYIKVVSSDNKLNISLKLSRQDIVDAYNQSK